MMEVAPTCQVNVITQHTSVIQCVFIGQWNCFNLKLEHKRLSIVKIVSSCRFSTNAFPRNDPYSAVVSCASSLRIVLLRFFRAECQENRTYRNISRLKRCQRNFIFSCHYINYSSRWTIKDIRFAPCDRNASDG